jgi:hypothetical protein
MFLWLCIIPSDILDDIAIKIDNTSSFPVLPNPLLAVIL